jgi:hypothetical protein
MQIIALVIGDGVQVVIPLSWALNLKTSGPVID